LWMRASRTSASSVHSASDVTTGMERELVPELVVSVSHESVLSVSVSVHVHDETSVSVSRERRRGGV
jgi:hypothetical protein